MTEAARASEAGPAVTAARESRASSESSAPAESWTPADCTLPTADRPLRSAEFRDLFDGAVMSSERMDETRLQLRLRRDRAIAARAAALTIAETECCSFFVFALTVTSDSLLLDVTVPAARADILDAMAVQARA
jgi:hypothetical protein